MSYLGNSPSYLGNSPLNRLFSDVTRIATQGQTAFQFSYTPGVAIVLRNGVILDADKFTATDGSLITLATPANAGDSIRCIALNQFNVADALPLSGGSMGGPLTLAGNSVDPMNPVALAEFIGANQSKAVSGYQKLPGGLIIQWGEANVPTANTTTRFSFPIAFPNSAFQIVAVSRALTGFESAENFCAAAVVSASQYDVRNYYNASDITFSWIAIGY